MNVALYAAMLAPSAPTGIHRYVAELACALFTQHPDRYRLLSSSQIHSGGVEPDPDWIPSDMPFQRLPGPRRVLHLSWYLTRHPKIDRFVSGLDLLHLLYPAFPVPVRVPFVFTLHDLLLMETPEAYSRQETFFGRAALRDAAARAARIVAVSGLVAEAAADRLSIDRSRITVVHHGIGARFREEMPADTVAAVCARFGVEPGRYLLYVGRVETRKNLPTLLKALARRGPGARLMVAGPAGVGADDVANEIDRLGLANEVIMTGHVADADLPLLMAGALALVHPSRFEGFGFTPLEAMSAGTPAIASRAGALPEVLGDAAALVDPDDVDGWAEAMSRIENDPDYAATLAAKGRRHAVPFTWERAAQETAAVHEGVLKN